MSVVTFENWEHFRTYGYDKLLFEEAQLMFKRAQAAMLYDVSLANQLWRVGCGLETAARIYVENLAKG